MTIFKNLVRTFVEAAEQRMQDEIRAFVNPPKKKLAKQKQLTNKDYAGRPPDVAPRYVPVAPGVEYLSPPKRKPQKRKRASG